VLDAIDIDYNGRNVLVSHQFFTKMGVTPERSESETDPIGGLDAIDTSHIERFDYVALGHLHGSQIVGKESIRYAGSPVKYSFSECRQKKSVTLVELNNKGELAVTALPLTPIHDMREIKGEIDQLMNRGVVAAADSNDYLRVVLTNEDYVIDPIGKLRSVYPNIMSLDFENSRTEIDLSSVKADAEKVSALSPHDLFGEFFFEVTGSTMTEEQSAIIRELLEMEGDL
jgi:exonuclease SbcD